MNFFSKHVNYLIKNYDLHISDDLRIGIIDKEEQSLKSQLVLDGLSHISSCKLSNDYRKTAVASSKGQLTIYELEKSRKVLSLSGNVSSSTVGRENFKIQFGGENELFYSYGINVFSLDLRTNAIVRTFRSPDKVRVQNR